MVLILNMKISFIRNSELRINVTKREPLIVTCVIYEKLSTEVTKKTYEVTKAAYMTPTASLAVQFDSLILDNSLISFLPSVHQLASK